MSETRDTDPTVHPKAIERERAAKERRKRGIFGAVLFVVGLAAALVAMWWLESLPFATLWIAVAMVGGGYLAAGDVKGIIGGGK